MSRLYRHAPLIVMIASALVQLLAVGLYHSFERRSVPVDYLNRYKPQAEAILAGGGMLLHGQPQTPPLYPLALSGLIGLSRAFACDADSLALAFNIILMALAAGGFAFLMRSAFNARLSLLAGLVWCTYPFGIYLGLGLGPEPMYLFSLVVVSWSLLRLRGRDSRQALLAGLLCGCAMLVKPIGLLLPFVGIVAIIAAARKDQQGPRWWLSRAALLLLGTIIVLLPWEWYIYHRTGTLTVLSTKGGATAYEGWTFGLTPGADGRPMQLPITATEFMNGVENNARSGSASSVLAAVAQAAAAHPAGFVQTSLIKAARCFYGTDERWHEREIIIIQLFYALAAAAGLWLWRRRRRGQGTMLLTMLGSLALLHWLMAFATFSILRYMIPGSFLMAAFAGLLCDELLPGKIKAAGP